MNDAILMLPHVNAGLNSLAAVLLVVGFVLIKQGREIAHRNVMLAAFGTSVLFLICYLTYHVHMKLTTGEAGLKFSPSYGQTIRSIYLAILATHVVLAALVPFMALYTIYLGLADYRTAHNRWAWRTFPIWLYVSITGVVIYVMLYHLYPPPELGQ